jgi:hypothetical protein
MHTKIKYALLASLIALAACGGDKTKDDAASAKPGAPTETPDQYRKRQQAFADSVLNTTKPASKVAADLGKGYAVGSIALRDTLAALASSTGCYKTGRNTDPYLAGTVSIFAHMAVIGVDLIQVQESGTKWTSAAGNLVNACLSTEMKKWKLDMTFGKPAAYIVQVQFKTDTTALPHVDTTAKAVPAKKP